MIEKRMTEIYFWTNLAVMIDRQGNGVTQHEYTLDEAIEAASEWFFWRKKIIHENVNFAE